MQGNDCYVDGHGFIKYGEINNRVEYSKHSGIFQTASNNLNALIRFNPNKLNKIINTTTCWICEGWTENTFTIKDGISFSEIEEPIYIHFEFNNYQAELME